MNLRERIRQASEPLEARPAHVQTRLDALPTVRAVFFDVYGTLLISGCGDLGVHAGDLDRTAWGIQQAIETVSGIRLDPPCPSEFWTQTIAASHRRSRDQGIDYPEVEIRDIWRELLTRYDREFGPVNDPRWPALQQAESLQRLAIEYELATNPLWPMPGARELLSTLTRRGFRLGIVSNAQFYTPLAMEALLGKSMAELGFEPAWCEYSYVQGWAKPSEHPYRVVAERLALERVLPEQVLYVGNDLLNDMVPAQAVGFRTAWFAGDQRSFRDRVGDPRVADARPDVLLTSLSQLESVLSGVDQV